MDDALLVRGFERLGDLRRDRQRLVDRDRPARDPLRQVLPLDQFHHERREAVTRFEAVDRRDVRMIQRRQRLRFAREPRHPLAILRERVGQHLERHVAIERRVAGPEDLPHPARANRRKDLVDAKPAAGSQGHVAASIDATVRGRSVRGLSRREE